MNLKVCGLLLLLLCMSMAFGACSSDEDDADKNESVAVTPTVVVTPSAPVEPTATPEPTATEAVTPTPTEAAAFSFDEAAKRAERMIREAVEAFHADDYARLEEPVRYYVLWLGFTHVTYGELDFQMTDFDREYLKAVALNYEKSVESIADHNVDIIVDLHFIDEVMPLTKSYDEDWLYLDQNTVMPVIERYLGTQEVDTVLTTVQTAGEENRLRNMAKEGYGVHDVILGLQTAGISSSLGYSTFNLTTPKEGTYPLADPEIPSLYATAVAVHEWMHQLEYMKTLLGVEYPDTHAYMGETEGYQKYIADQNDYDFFEFYKLVLSGRLPYRQGDSIKLVGMYPKMWPLIKRDVFGLGEFTIKAADGSGYLAGRDGDPALTVSDDPCVWTIRYSAEGRFMLSPKELPNLLIDLGNAWDVEGNTIGLWGYTGYVNAQSWRIDACDDGTYYLRTPYESGRVITVKKGQPALLCTVGAEGAQRWTIERK